MHRRYHRPILFPSHPPFRHQCHRHSLLLAVSRGEKKAGGFPSVMRQVKEHLIRCPATRAVIVVCDHWRPDEHIGDLRACHDRGVRFMFLLVGIPGRVVAPVAVDLGLIP